MFVLCDFGEAILLWRHDNQEFSSITHTHVQVWANDTVDDMVTRLRESVLYAEVNRARMHSTALVDPPSIFMCWLLTCNLERKITK